MRYFSPFAILGLLHVARGGELDAFAGDRARNARERLAHRSVPVVDTSNNSSSAPRSDLPNVSKRELERREAHERALDHLDTNGDGHIGHDEIIKSLAFHWDGEHTARKMLRAFGAPDMENIMKKRSLEGDGKVSKEAMTDILDTRPLDKPHYCPSIRTKVESCPTQAVLKCGAYLTAAESFCNAGVQNMVEKCIMSESCDNMCACITAVEDAAHGNAAIVYQDQLVHVDPLNFVGHPESSLQSRQFGEELLFGMFIWAIIEWIVGITAAYIIGNIYASLTSANPWMDTVGWDGEGAEPACSSFVYWGNCGAILSSTARNCPDGGQRVFGNSCKDHFRYGSKGCGFLGLGCKSLCSKVNPVGCPCSLFDWSEFDNQDMPGFDMNKGSFFTDKVSVCRNACAGNSTCQAFVIAPFSGNENDKRPNCFLKTAQRQTQTVGGSTVFFKRGANGKCGAPTYVTGVPYDDDWFTTSTGTDRRSISDSGHSILPRTHKGDVPFPFDRTTAGYLTLLLIRLIYQRLTTELTWRNNPFMQRPIGGTQASDNGSGPGTRRPAGLPYLGNLNLPQWRPTEIAYRVNGMFRNIINTAMTNVDDPVARWLNQNVPTTPGQRAQFPDSVRQLLLRNSGYVHDLSRGNGITWVGQNRQVTGKVTAPFPNVQVGYDQGMGFFQRGNAGPFSVEAAFLMATQLAGINFRAVARAYQTNPAGWWMGVLTPGLRDRQCLQELDPDGVQIRTYGRIIVCKRYLHIGIDDKF
ncbi:hypothetical protein FRC08_018453 [Ceratobasidium sp. 394]|nr:hypothetical protein FRC08_018453 [Ceratobasidium sp. 394]